MDRQINSMAWKLFRPDVIECNLKIIISQIIFFIYSLVIKTDSVYIAGELLLKIIIQWPYCLKQFYSNIQSHTKYDWMTVGLSIYTLFQQDFSTKFQPLIVQEWIMNRNKIDFI